MTPTMIDLPHDDDATSPARIGFRTAKTAWYWFDFICPFCYVARTRNEILKGSGLLVIELPFQVHPEIPADGVVMGPRSGAMYERLEREARDAGLPLHWPARVPNSRYALSVAEWVRRYHPGGFAVLYSQLFLSHFSLGEDIGDAALVDHYAVEAGADATLMGRAILDGSTNAAVNKSERAARRVGIAGTPAWLVEDQLLNGLESKELFERLARRACDQSSEPM